MKIAIIGYGRMGHRIEEIAQKRGHRIVCTVDEGESAKFESDEFRSADVAIEFSVPSQAVDNILRCFAVGLPVVSGTTGWRDSLPEIKELCDKGKGTLLYSSNFSIGVNLFMAVNRYAAGLFEKFPQYVPSMTEIHHIHKLDHPSGTAISLADDIVARQSRLEGWAEAEVGDLEPLKKGLMPVAHLREGEVPGTHIIRWDSAVDEIEYTHKAFSRDGFASGAVDAAEWLVGKSGFFSMSDMLSDITGTLGVF